ncbi:hypothetical protein ACNGGR_07705 [Campylobacter jejuni]
MKDKSLEEIDLLKLIICALSFISVCTALILFLLLPTLKNYKQANLRENSQLAILKAAKLKFDFSEDKISTLRSENNKSLEQFEQNFNIGNFDIFLQKYFQNVKIQVKSIFDQSYTTYYRLDNGWYRFVSISKQIPGVADER